MKVPAWVRKARLNPKLIKLAKAMRVNTYFKKIYYRFTLPGSKKIKIILFGYPANFYVNTIGELMMIDTSLIDPREGEIKALERILERLNQGDIAYDIGASIGTHTIFMAMKIGEQGKVIAFEPQENSYKSLITNISLNSLDNIVAIKAAVGNRFSEEVIYGCSEDSFGLFSLTEHINGRYSKKIELVAGDAFVRRQQLPLPNVVKIDVEGYEYYVIQGLKETLMQDKCRMVFCELHPTMLPKGITPDDVITLLKSYGFNKIEIYPRGVTLHSFCYKAG